MGCNIFFRNRFNLSGLALALSCSTNAVGQASPNAGALQNILEQQVNRDALQPQTQPSRPEKKIELDATEKNLFIKRFEYKGNELFSSERLAKITAPWVNRNISFNELKAATSAIQDFYFNEGRIAQALIPPQEIKDGVLYVQIIEGKLGSIKIERVDGASRFSDDRVRAYLTKGADDRLYIDTKELERGLLLLNEVPGVSVAGTFEGGTAVGTSDFKVQIQDGALFTGQAGVSNYGSSSTGVGQALANLSLNNLSGRGDQATADLIQSQGSSFGQLGYHIPVGAKGWKLGIQGSYLNYKTLSSWSDNPTQGTASTFSAYTSYALQRSQVANSNVRFSLDSRRYSNQQAGSTISDYQVSALTAGINGNWANTDKSVITYGLNFVLGHLDISNLNQAGQDTTGPGTAGSYAKLGFNLSHTQQLKTLPNTTWLNSVYGQFANKNLNSSEQIFMGGPFGLRAYPVSQGGGSQGAIFTSELNHRLTESWQVGGFVDVGVVQQYVSTFTSWQGLTNAGNVYYLADTGLTAKYTYKQVNVASSLAYRVGNNPLYTSSGQQLNADNAYKTVQVWVKVSLYF